MALLVLAKGAFFVVFSSSLKWLYLFEVAGKNEYYLKKGKY
jgi:hypothetical protein